MRKNDCRVETFGWDNSLYVTSSFNIRNMVKLSPPRSGTEKKSDFFAVETMREQNVFTARHQIVLM